MPKTFFLALSFLSLTSLSVGAKDRLATWFKTIERNSSEMTGTKTNRPLLALEEAGRED